MKPKVTIITSAFNDAAYISAAIRSVQAQSFPDWEYILINDKSTDNTGKIIRKFSRTDRRIRYLENPTNLGLTASLNRALKLARSPYIARLDSDDTWTDPDKLKKQLAFLAARPDYAMVGTWAWTTDTLGRRIKILPCPIRDRDIRSYILIENCFIHSSVLFCNSVLQKTGLYNPEYSNAMDYDLWLRIGRVSKFHNLPETMVTYRINPNGLTRSKYSAQVRETTEIAWKNRAYYPHALLGLLLWKLRTTFPEKIRVSISNILKSTHIRYS